MYQKLKESEKFEDDFINIAAHKLRIPIQPILGLADIHRFKETGGERSRILFHSLILKPTSVTTVISDILVK